MNIIYHKLKHFITLAILATALPSVVHAQAADPVMPKPRAVSVEEQLALGKAVFARFQQNLPRDAGYYAAGPFRFVHHKGLHYIERTDLGSVALENPNYGISGKALDPLAVSPKILLPRIEQAVKATGIDLSDYKFARFLDEFAGSVQPAFIARNFDPRKSGLLVARTALYERNLQGISVFGSELIVGLMPDGAIGRIRHHAPKIDPRLLEQALILQKSVAAGEWKIPTSLVAKDTKILEVMAGVGHSVFADPSFRAAAVVRVLYRTSSPDAKFPLQTTGFNYFDPKGNEVQLTLFPRMAETPVKLKRGG